MVLTCGAFHTFSCVFNVFICISCLLYFTSHLMFPEAFFLHVFDVFYVLSHIFVLFQSVNTCCMLYVHQKTLQGWYQLS